MLRQERNKYIAVQQSAIMQQDLYTQEQQSQQLLFNYKFLILMSALHSTKLCKLIISLLVGIFFLSFFFFIKKIYLQMLHPQPCFSGASQEHFRSKRTEKQGGKRHRTSKERGWAENRASTWSMQAPPIMHTHISADESSRSHTPARRLPAFCAGSAVLSLHPPSPRASDSSLLSLFLSLSFSLS